MCKSFVKLRLCAWCPEKFGDNILTKTVCDRFFFGRKTLAAPQAYRNIA
jgi:hypothetical protein